MPNYEVMTHKNREEFQEHLDALPPHKTLHSFEWDAPNIVAVYQWSGDERRHREVAQANALHQ